MQVKLSTVHLQAKIRARNEEVLQHWPLEEQITNCEWGFGLLKLSKD